MDQVKLLDVALVVNSDGLDGGLGLGVVGDGNGAVEHCSDESGVVILGKGVGPLSGLVGDLDVVGFDIGAGDEARVLIWPAYCAQLSLRISSPRIALTVGASPFIAEVTVMPSP